MYRDWLLLKFQMGRCAQFVFILGVVLFTGCELGYKTIYPDHGVLGFPIINRYYDKHSYTVYIQAVGSTEELRRVASDPRFRFILVERPAAPVHGTPSLPWWRPYEVPPFYFTNEIDEKGMLTIVSERDGSIFYEQRYARNPENP